MDKVQYCDNYTKFGFIHSLRFLARSFLVASKTLTYELTKCVILNEFMVKTHGIAVSSRECLGN
jgi:hypothetical protein